MVYILEFDRPIGTERHSARYYIGWCEDHRFNARMRHPTLISYTLFKGGA